MSGTPTLFDEMRPRQGRVNAALEAALARVTRNAPGPVHDAMAYSLLAPGKRLRPLLVMLACEAAGGEAQALQADLTVPAQAAALVERTLQAFGRIDVLVNNAFAPYSFDPERRRDFARLAWPDFLRQYEGSVGAAFHLCQAVLPHLRSDVVWPSHQCSGFFTPQLYDGHRVHLSSGSGRHYGRFRSD